MVQIPEWVPIFPLHNTVFFPNTLLPLHIFEERYKQLLKDVMSQHSLLVISLVSHRPSNYFHQKPKIHDLATVGKIIEVEQRADTNFDILLSGISRVKIKHHFIPEGKMYLMGQIEPISETVDDELKKQLSDAMASLKSICSQLAIESSNPHPEIIKSINKIDNPAAFADMIISTSVDDIDEKQRLLEEPDIKKRIEAASAALASHLIATRKADKKSWGIEPGDA